MAAATPQNFAGQWHWASGQEELTLNLVQDGNAISGTHAAIGQNGDRVDEADAEGPPSITGTIDGGTALVTFRSAYPDSSGGGKARLVLRKGRLMWRVIESSGEHYLPRAVTLKRVESEH